MEIIHIFHSNHFDYKGYFRTAVDLYYCLINGLNMAENEVLRILHFKMITAVRGTIQYGMHGFQS